MAYTFDAFCADCNKALKADAGEAGRGEVRKHLDKILERPEFIGEILGADPSVGRHIVHHDKETDMYVMAHVFKEPGSAMPHDHGPYWVIYGNSAGPTNLGRMLGRMSSIRTKQADTHAKPSWVAHSAPGGRWSERTSGATG